MDKESIISIRMKKEESAREEGRKKWLCRVRSAARSALGRQCDTCAYSDCLRPHSAGRSTELPHPSGSSAFSALSSLFNRLRACMLKFLIRNNL